ncbi:hypothetical protein AWC11_11280 [Mycobacterium interjectum]|nr:hypothetical protein AWC11_11280 [Mycobacterium interjectum]
MSDDDAPTSAGPCDDHTTVQPPAPDIALQLAWSLDDGEPLPPARSWRAACGVAALLLSAAVGAAVAVGILARSPSPAHHGGAHVDTAGAEKAIAAPPAMKVVDRAPPTDALTAGAPLASHGDPDQMFINELRRNGIAITDESAAIGGAKLGCAYLASGHSPQAAVELALRNNPSLTVQNAEAYVDATIRAYCPQYGSGEHGP